MLSLLNISSSFSASVDIEPLSPVNASDLRDFLGCLIRDDVSTSGELTRSCFAFLHDGLTFSGVASERLVPDIVGRVTVFTISNKLPRVRIFREQELHTRSEYSCGSSSKTNLTCLQTSASTIPKESLRCYGLNRFCDDE